MKLLVSDTPMFSIRLFDSWRLAALGVGLVLLIFGSIFLPSDDWDIGICFAMGLPAYVLAPWVFRQVYYIRWRWMFFAALAFWVSIDGVYSFYWYLRDFEHLAQFRPANFIYCTPIFWMAGFVWNLDFRHFSSTGGLGRWEKASAFLPRMLFTLLIGIIMTLLVGFISNSMSRFTTG